MLEKTIIRSGKSMFILMTGKKRKYHALYTVPQRLLSLNCKLAWDQVDNSHDKDGALKVELSKIPHVYDNNLSEKLHGAFKKERQMG